MTRFPFTATLIVLLISSSSWADEPVGLRANHRLIGSETRGILGLAHPTVRYTGIENDGRENYRDGSYRLSYVFNFSDGGESGYRVIHFNFDKAGKLTALSFGSGSTLVPAFFGSDLILEVVKAGLKESKNADDPVVKELMKVRSSKEFLLKYLQWRQGS